MLNKGSKRNDLVHLNVKTPYSFYEAAGRIPDLVNKANENNHTAIAFTDRNRVSGLISAYKESKEKGVKPVLGLQLDSLEDANRSILLWAKDLKGYGELCKLASDRHLDPEFKLTRIVSNLSDHVIVSSYEQDLIEVMQESLQRGNYYGGLPLFERDTQLHKTSRRLYDYCRKHEIPLVASESITSACKEELETVDLLHAIGKRVFHYENSKKPSRAVGTFYNDPTLFKLYKNIPEAFDNTVTIAEQCNVDLRLGELKFPAPVLSNRSEFEELRYRAEEGALLRYGPSPPEVVRERLAYELGVIAHLGFTGYILVVHDIASKAWARGVRTIGRGSAANSMVCYCLKLTDICPIKYDLYFERFLNPERSSPPDIDLDFSWRDRDEILHGVYETYGDDRVAMISTIVTFKARAALRETALAKGIPDDEISRITKYVPHFSNVESLQQLPDEVPSCRNLPFDREPWASIARQANKLLKLPRHLSIHAGGIVITPTKITDWTGLERARKGFVVTHYDMYGVEDLGLVKIDLLSQRALGVLKDTVNMVQENQNLSIPIDDKEKVFNDYKTRELIRSGKSMGVFYVESPGMISLLRKMSCDNFELLVAASSVIRPGVSESGMMQQYIDCVRDPSKASYLHPKMEKLLCDTFGVMIYQEDVIKVAHHIAGLSLGKADMLRRAMSGKHRSADDMEKLKKQFVEGCHANQVQRGVAEEIWRQIASFAGYSFCKAHSASFAVLSMQIAYLKAHHSTEFFASVLANGGGFYSQAAYIEEAKRWDIEVKLPSVNSSRTEHYGKNKTIFLGLNAIGALREESIEKIISRREEDGPYISLADFMARNPVARDEVEAMIRCGALDCLDKNRPTLLRNLKAGYQTYVDTPGPLALGAADVFESLPDAKDWSPEEKYLNEREIMGYSPGPHPLSIFKLPYGKSIPASRMADHEGKYITMVGWAFAHKKIQTRKKKETMEFMSLEDLTGTFEATLFPKTYTRYAPILKGNGPYRMSGLVESEYDVYTLTVNRVEKIGEC